MDSEEAVILESTLMSVLGIPYEFVFLVRDGVVVGVKIQLGTRPGGKAS